MLFRSELQKAGMKGATASEAAQPDPEEEISAEPEDTAAEEDS